MEAALLADFTLEELKGFRREAVAALHALNSGARIVSAGYGDQRTSFQEGNRRDLEAWIAALNGAIAAQATGLPVRAPITLAL